MGIQLRKAQLLTYGLPILVILSSITIALSPILKQHPELATAITYDLTLTAPLLFLLLSRKSNTSKLKAVPFFIGGTLIASYLLPKSEQQHLDFIIKYIVPTVELAVFTIILHKVYKAVKVFKFNSEQNLDFYIISKKSTKELFGKSRLAAFFASEIAMFYYAFFSWRKKKLQLNEFTKYKENSSIALAGAFLMVVFIESYTIHLLLMKWSSVAAWILTATSIYTAFMIIGHIKALLKRPSVLTENNLILKNGLIADITINLIDINKIVFCSTEMAFDNLKIGNLGISKESTNHNIALYFNTPQTIEKVYGFTETCDILLVHMDNKKKFVDELNKKI